MIKNYEMVPFMTDLYKIVLIKDISAEKLIDFYKNHGSNGQLNIKDKILDDKLSFKCIGSVAIFLETNEIVASYLAIPQKLIANPSLNCVQSMDTLVSVDHRGRFLVEKMARVLYLSLEENGFDCVFGVPNLNIEKLRYSKLGWNAARQIYRYTFWFPLAFHLFAKMLLKKIITNTNRVESDKIFLKNWRRYLNDIELNYINFALDSGDQVYYTDDMLAIIQKDGIKCKVGMLRSKKNISLIKRLMYILVLMIKCNCSILVTYATEDSPTSKFLKLPILKTRSMRFAGRFLSHLKQVSFGEPSFEYIEFDTWRFPC